MISQWDEAALRRYLLGDLAVEEMDELEERYLADGDLFEQLMLVEDDLIEACVRSELLPEDREKFNAFYLTSPQRKEKVENAKAIREYLSRITVAKDENILEANERPSLRQRVRAILWPGNMMPGLAVATSIILAIGGAWMVYRLSQVQAQLKLISRAREELVESNRQLAREVGEQTSKSSALEQRVDEKQEENNDLAYQLADARRSFSGVITTTLLIGFDQPWRGAGEVKREIIAIKPETRLVRLRLILGKQQHRIYKAVLDDSGDPEIGKLYSFPAITRKKVKIPFIVTASKLMNGEHTISLMGANDSGDYELVWLYPVRIVRSK